jgi:histidinol dehydrogenase
MIALLDLRSEHHTGTRLSRLLPRPGTDVASAEAAAHQLVEDVRLRGEEALLEQAERFDGLRPPAIRVPQADLDRALEALDPAVRAALDEAIARVREASAAQVPPERVTRIAEGAEIVQRWQPVSRVGLYVPGGKAVYPSSVVMNVVPAQVAGVRSIALASPAQRAFGGAVHPVILGAARLLGIEEVYAMGGAGAVGAFAHGVESLGLEPVDVITGPGNVFVAAAKRAVKGIVGIDAEAGPTEILILADDSADPRVVAADLISQAEHDELAAAVLVTDSEALATRVADELTRQVAATKHSDRVRAALTGPQSAIVLVRDLHEGADVSNAYAPEHLEIQTADPESLLPRIENAGVVFLGRDAPVSLGDYLAGSNHVLPTGGQSRFSSGLGTSTFLRPQQVVRYSADALAAVRGGIRALSDAEDLPAHGDAVDARFSD